MALLPTIAILVGLFTVLATALVISARFLVNTAECQIKIKTSEGDGDQTFTVEGGTNLLDALLEAGLEIQNACGGRGSCGFCKVRIGEGGGELLPTEKPHLSKRDLATGTRLACQIRIKNDIRVEIPDFLETVSEMVKNETFDKHSSWRFKIKGEENEPL